MNGLGLLALVVLATLATAYRMWRSELVAELWAVHVEGPDDMLAARSRADADRYARLINGMYDQFAARPDVSHLDGRWHAVVVPWPYSAEGHAASLVEQQEENGA